MTWTYNNIRLFVQSFSLNDKNIIARLQPLSRGTVHQHFGNESPICNITAYVVGNTDDYDLRQLAKSNTSYELVTPWGSGGDLFLNNIVSKLERSVCQTLRPDLDEDSPVYLVDMELYTDV